MVATHRHLVPSNTGTQADTNHERLETLATSSATSETN